jgi:hypothetical protein
VTWWREKQLKARSRTAREGGKAILTITRGLRRAEAYLLAARGC